VLIDSGQLSPGSAAKLVRMTDGQAEVSDGPPPGGGQAPSAYFLIDCPDLDSALDWPVRIPAASYGTVEVRPPRQTPLHPCCSRPACTATRRPRTKDTIMPAYIAFLIDIRDQAAFTSYARAAAPTYALYGGSVALRGPIVGIIEGSLDTEPDTRLVIIQFPSLERARAWWESPQYRAAAKLRRPPVSDSRVFLVDGINLTNQQSPQHQRPASP
jgi:uncharacterized protein (DUF1330 family)